MSHRDFNTMREAALSGNLVWYTEIMEDFFTRMQNPFHWQTAAIQEAVALAQKHGSYDTRDQEAWFARQKELLRIPGVLGAINAGLEGYYRFPGMVFAAVAPLMKAHEDTTIAVA